jgi:cytochrome b6-f complex iron-sulfur subunit
MGWTYLPDEKVFVRRDAAGLRAMSAVCTHLGCTVEESEGGFRCPCHGSEFGEDGSNRAGPAPRPLPFHPLSKSPDGTLVVDLGAAAGADDVLPVEEGR